MNSLEAREILSRYRPGVDDASDPETATALHLLQQDAELESWWGQQLEFHAAVRGALRQVPVPPQIKDNILARAHPPRRLAWWQQPALLAAAAAILLLLGGLMLWEPRSEDSTFPAFRKRMARVAVREYRMDLITSDLGQIRRYLAEKGPLGDYTLSKPLERLTAFGCAALKWHNRPVSMVCFKQTTGDLVWLFVVQRSSIRGAPSAQEPQFASVGKLMTASWSQGDRTYVLGVIGDEQLLRRYL